MRTFVLCPQEDEVRKDKARKHFEEKGIGIEFINPLNAVTAGLKTTLTYEVDDPGSGFNMGPKPVGIWLAHWNLWNMCQFMADRHFMILETDAMFPDRFWETTMEILRDVPADYDMLYIGNCCAKGKPNKHIKGRVFQVEGVMCLHCYILAKKAIPLLISTLRKVWAPIDIDLVFNAHPKLKVYTVLPSLVGQFDTETLP